MPLMLGGLGGAGNGLKLASKRSFEMLKHDDLATIVTTIDEYFRNLTSKVLQDRLKVNY